MLKNLHFSRRNVRCSGPGNEYDESQSYPSAPEAWADKAFFACVVVPLFQFGDLFGHFQVLVKDERPCKQESLSQKMRRICPHGPEGLEGPKSQKEIIIFLVPPLSGEA